MPVAAVHRSSVAAASVANRKIIRIRRRRRRFDVNGDGNGIVIATAVTFDDVSDAESQSRELGREKRRE